MEAKILVADDGQVMRTVLTHKLTEKGYQVTAVSGGNEAVEKIARESFDLVLLDIHMPDIDGIEVLTQIRGTFTASQLPVIMATAKDEEENIVRCFEAGANDFVAKPINFPVLFARLQTHLQLKRAVEELERIGQSDR